MQVSSDEYCGCGSGKKKLYCPNCPTGTTLCPCNKPYYNCPIHSGYGKRIQRDKTCLIHGKSKGRCPTCKEAEESTGEQHFFGKRERDAIAKAAANGAA